MKLGLDSRGFRIVYFFLFLIGIIVVEFGAASLLLFAEIIPDPDGWSNLHILIATIALEGPAAVLATLFFLRRDRLPFTAVGLAIRGSWVMDLARGLALGTGLIACAVFAGMILRQMDMSWNHLPFTVILRHGLALFALLALQCAIEELIFRGYPFQLCVALTTPLFSALLFSILFGVLHIFNTDVTVIAILNAVAAGVLLSVAFLKTRGLWFPIGLHWGWNFAQGFLFSVPVSGVTFPPDMFSTVSLGPAWLVGGMFGPEGGVLTFVITLSAAFFLWRTERISPDKAASSVFSGGPANAARES